jgi:hypothetical protein
MHKALVLLLLSALMAAVAQAQPMSAAQTQVQITPNSAAYSAGQCLGGVLTLPNMVRPSGPGGTILSGVSFIDSTHQSVASDAMTLLVFTAAPTGTYTDHANCQVAAADVPNLAGALSIASSNCVQEQGPTTTVCTITPSLPLNVTMPVKSSNLWVVPITVTRRPTAPAPRSFNFMAQFVARQKL